MNCSETKPKINYDLASKARVMLFAADGWPVQSRTVHSTGIWWDCHNPKWSFSTDDYRIALPPIPDGWRLVEMGERPAKFKTLYVNGNNWVDGEWGNQDDVACYRITPIAKPEPRKVPLTKADWDGHPVWWVRHINAGDNMITNIYLNEIACNGIPPTNMRELMVEGWQRSHDRKTWAPCYKLEEQS